VRAEFVELDALLSIDFAFLRGVVLVFANRTFEVDDDSFAFFSH
jgi:hypothetical protein